MSVRMYIWELKSGTENFFLVAEKKTANKKMGN